MNTVVLFFVFDDSHQNKCENLGLEIIRACLLKAGYNCILLYENFHDLANCTDSQIIEFADNIVKLNPRIVGSPVFSPTIDLIDKIAGKIKEVIDIKFISGGAMASQSPIEVLSYIKNIDYLVLGEGENTTINLCNRVISMEPVTELQGIAYKAENKIIVNDSCESVNLDDVICIERKIFQCHKPKMARLSTSRGCLGNCTFCAHSRTFKPTLHKWKGKEPIKIADEMEQIFNKYGIRLFDIIDNSFEDPTPGIGKERLNQFADLLLEKNLGIYYTVFFRTDSFSDNNSDLELLKKLKKSGLIHIVIGIENGDDEVLKIYGKHANSFDNYKTLKILNDVGFTLEMGFIMFNPYTEYDDLINNINFISKIKFVGDNFAIYKSKLALYHNVPFYNKLVRDKLVDENFSLKNPYGYLFCNKQIGNLAKIMGDVDNSDFNKLWYYSQNIENMMHITENMNYDNYCEVKKELEKVKLVLANMHLDFFEGAVNISKKGFSTENIVAHANKLYTKEKYLDLYSNLSKKVNSFLFKNRSKKIHKIIL